MTAAATTPRDASGRVPGRWRRPHFDELDEQQRSVLEAFAQTGQSAHEIGADLDMPASAVRTILAWFCGFDRDLAAQILAGHPALEYQEPPALEPGTEPEDLTVDLPEMLAATGLSYRKIDYWTSRGYLQVVSGPANPGIGHPRRWPRGEVDIAKQVVRLVGAGMALSRAVRIARSGRHELAPGIRLVVEDEQGDAS